MSYYYTEFVRINGKDAAILHDEEGSLVVCVVADEYERTEYFSAAMLRQLADKLDSQT